MDQYFDWYPMAEERKVRLAKMRLTKLAKTYWLNLRPPQDDSKDHLLRLIKIEAPSFDGSHQPSEYLDWEASMDQYFD